MKPTCAARESRPADSSPVPGGAVVVLPTYNERENLEDCVRALLEQDPRVQVLVVDDASPDGTGAVADRLAGETTRVRVLHRPGKLGLGSAYRDGFAWVLANTQAESICQMDCDFSHAPSDMGRLLAAASSADVVVGSRYVSGARIENWPLRRKWLSAGANRFARTLTRLPQHDATAGMKCFARRVLEAIDPATVRSEGYAFQIEMSWRVWKAGCSVREVPILFRDRTKGASKLSRRVVLEALGLVIRLAFRRAPECAVPSVER